MADLELEPSIDANEGRVAIRGEIDVATAPQLRDVLYGLVDQGVGRIVLDCRELGFLDSSGIGLLVATRKRLGDDGELAIEGLPEHIRKVLEITGVAGELSLRP